MEYWTVDLMEHNLAALSADVMAAMRERMMVELKVLMKDIRLVALMDSMTVQRRALLSVDWMVM